MPVMTGGSMPVMTLRRARVMPGRCSQSAGRCSQSARIAGNPRRTSRIHRAHRLPAAAHQAGAAVKDDGKAYPAKAIVGVAGSRPLAREVEPSRLA
jgi:hypothetical protein